MMQQIFGTKMYEADSMTSIYIYSSKMKSFNVDTKWSAYNRSMKTIQFGQPSTYVF